jgi:predicted DNA-binding protein (UPF0251 family)
LRNSNEKYFELCEIYEILLNLFFEFDSSDTAFLRSIFGERKSECVWRFVDSKNIKKEDTELYIRILGMIYQTVEWSKLRDIKLLQKEIEAIKDRVKLTAYQKNQCKMKAGRPIALKGKYSDVLKLELQGLSDKEICEKLGGISKTTLWRYRKQAGVSNK